MKKISIIIAIILLTAFSSTSVFADAGITLSSSKNVTAGEEFAVSLTVIPEEGEKVYTVKAVLSYPEDKVEPISFVFAPEWLVLSQPGYNVMSGGSVIKTAGYPNGFTGSQLFGTLTLRAKSNGVVSISLSEDTEILNAGNKNVFSGDLNNTDVVIGEAVNEAAEQPSIVPTTQPSAPAAQISETNTPAGNSQDSEAEDSAESDQAAPETTDQEESAADSNSQAATALFGAEFLTSENILYSIAVLFLIALGFVAWRKFKKGHSGK